jgi:sarcosine oxidase subunit beta
MGHDGNRVERLVTRRGVWEVDTVVNAAGPWGAKVAGLAGTAVDLVPQRIQVAVATGFQDGVTGMPLVGWPGEVDGERGWCRGEDGDMLLFGQHRHLPDPLHTVDPDFVDMANDETYPGRVADLVRRHWKLPTAQFLPGWNCIYGSTPDGYPILGADVNLQNLVHVLGCNGHGITLHAGLAQAVAALVLRRSSTLRLDDVPGAPPVLDVSWLTQKRFTNGSLLSFDFERPSPCEDLIAREQIEGKAP